MKEERVANENQKVYARNSGDQTMADGNTSPEKREPVKKQEQNAEAKEREEEKAKRPDEKDGGKKAEEKRATVGEVFKISKERVKQKIPLDEVKKLIPQVPQSSNVNKVVNEFYAACSEGARSGLLIRYYVKLHAAAKEAGTDLHFLNDLKKELALREINADALVVEYPAKTTAVKTKTAEQLRKEWRASYTEEELKNPVTLSAIEDGVARGKPSPNEVYANAQLSDKERFAKAEELLGKQLAPTERAALLEAHYEGIGEQGKNGLEAGVYNYTSNQLARKVQILEQQGGFKDPKTRRALIEAGLAATPVSVNNIDDLRLRLQLNILNRALEPIAENDIRSQVEELEKALDRLGAAVGVDTGQAEILAQRIQERLNSLRETEEQGGIRGRRGGLTRYEERSRATLYGERLITQEEYENVYDTLSDIVEQDPNLEKPMEELLERLGPIDMLFNRMFDKADANPHADFEHAMGSAGQMEYGRWTTFMNDIKNDLVKENERLSEERRSGRVAEAEEEEKNRKKIAFVERLIKKYSAEYKLRELLHNAYYIAETGGEAKNFAGYTSQFQSEFFDLALMGAPEVEVALRIREQVLYQIKRENGGRIPYEKVAYIGNQGWSEWEKRTRDLLIKANEEKKLFGDSPINEWRIEKAISVSRGLGMITLRFPEIVAECPLGAPPSLNEGQPSIPWETISWELNPLDHKLKRYQIGSEMAAMLYAPLKRKPKGFLGMWNQDELRLNYGYNAVQVLADIGEEKRMIDLRSLSKIGGPFTHSSWRGYVSALNNDRSELRKLLQRNPGLQNKLLWDAYLIGGLADEKKRFIDEYKRDNPDIDVDRDPGFLQAWKAEETRLTEVLKPAERRKEADIMAWKASAARIPHVVLRILMDDANSILSQGEINSLTREIFGNLSGKALQDAITDTETDLTLVKEYLMKRRREKIEDAKRNGGTAEEADFSEGEDRLLDTDFEIGINDPQRRERAKNLLRVVQRELDKQSVQKTLIAKFDGRELPFALTMEDVAWSEFRFSQTGGRGFITRRNNDWLSEAEANNAVIELIKKVQRFSAPEEMVAQLAKIFDAAEVHDRARAEEYIGMVATGLIRFMEKDGILKIPIYGQITGLFNAARKRGSSFAQTAYGVEAPAWDNDDIYNFLEQLRTVLPGEAGKRVIEKVKKETGGTLPLALFKRTKVALWLLMLFLSYEMGEKILKGEKG